LAENPTRNSGRERLKNALDHHMGSLPMDFDGTAVTGMHVSCVAALRRHYGLERQPVKVHEPYQMLGKIEEDLKQALGIDVEGVYPPRTMFGFANHHWKEWKAPDGSILLVSEEFRTTSDAAGNTYIYPQGDLSVPPSAKMPADGCFFDTIIRQEPIDEDRLNPEDNLEEFQPVDDADLDYFRKAVASAAATGRGVIANFGGTALGDIALVPAPFLKHPKGIRDVAEWYMITRRRQDFVHHIFARQCALALENLSRIHQAVGNAVDAVFLCGTDFGTQNSAFCSVETFRHLYMPYYQRINEWIHRHTAWKTFKHSCGSIERFIPAMMESGFDILNPVQCSASHMDPEYLKQTYGDRLVFWGGCVDTQKTLPFGTPDRVREEVLRRCEILGKDGGLVFNSIHNIQAHTPVANIVAMIEALHEFNRRY